MKFSSEFVSAALGVACHSFEARRVSTDSRSLLAKDLFAAIRGDNFDGHAFVDEALKKGAVGIIVDKNFSSPNPDVESRLIRVDNPTAALRRIASAHRERLQTKVFVVAGSNGKTTTKELLAFLLSELHGETEVFKTKKSENSVLGVALSLLNIREEKYSVLEVGIDEPGWMEQHLQIIRPELGLITSIQEEHLEKLKSIEKVAEEELKLLDFLLSSNGRFAANLDSEWVAKRKFPIGSLSYSLERKADIEGSFSNPRRLSCFGIDWMNPLPGPHNASNLLAALSGLMLIHPDLSKNELLKLSKSMEKFQGEAHRSQWLQQDNEVFVFDDCYNANPGSVEKSLSTFKELSKGLEPIIVLGDMRELGEASNASHKRILNIVEVLGFKNILLFGPNYQKALAEIPKHPAKCFLDIEDLKMELKSKLKKRQAVFLKASRGMRLERLLDIWNK